MKRNYVGYHELPREMHTSAFPLFDAGQCIVETGLRTQWEFPVREGEKVKRFKPFTSWNLTAKKDV